MKRLLILWNIATGSLLLMAGLLKALDGETLRDVLVYLGVSPATACSGSLPWCVWKCRWGRGSLHPPPQGAPQRSR